MARCGITACTLGLTWPTTVNTDKSSMTFLSNRERIQTRYACGLRERKISGLIRVGMLFFTCRGGEVRLLKPQVYQEIDGKKQTVQGQYRLMAEEEVGLVLSAYDTSRELIIDPVLSYSTYLGGNHIDAGLAITVDGSGNAYVTGPTRSPNFPTTAGVVQPNYGGDFRDAFVVKLNSRGTTIVYATYLGGNADDNGYGIKVDESGNVYVTGNTKSTNFPVTSGVVQQTLAGGFDAFVAKLNSVGSALGYATLVGGTNDDVGWGIVVDGSGSAYVSGQTGSANFPTTPGVVRQTSGGAIDAFVVKLNPTGTAFGYATFLGGSGSDVGYALTVDVSSNVYVTGDTGSANFPTVSGPARLASGGSLDAFVVKLNATGTSVGYTTFLSGNANDTAYGIALDGSSNVYVTGDTASSNFPVTPGAVQQNFGGSRDAFVAKLNPAGTPVFATYLGGSGIDFGLGIAVDGGGNMTVAGDARSANFPVTSDAVQPVFGGGVSFGDGFVAQLSPSGTSVLYATYLGGSADDAAFGVVVDGSSNVYVTGGSRSVNFPVTAGSRQVTNAGLQDIFIVKLLPNALMSVDKSVLSFPNTAVGSAQDLTFSIGNSGSTTIEGVVNLAGDGFSLLSGGGVFSLPPQNNRTVTIRFSPSSSGSFGGVVNISSTGGPASVQLSGSGAGVGSGPLLSVCSQQLDFGSVTVGNSVVLQCTVTNTGTGTLAGTANASGAGFSLLSDASFNLGAGLSETVQLQFQPSQAGSAIGVLTVTAGGTTVPIPLIGNGLQGAALEISPTTLNFGGVRVGQNRDLTFTVRNVGSSLLTRKICVPSGFIVSPSDNVSLPPTQSQVYTLRFTPPILSPPPYNGTVTFSQTTCIVGATFDAAKLIVSGSGAVTTTQGVAYIVNRDEGTVSVVDIHAQREVRLIVVGTAPTELVLTPDGRKGYVCNFGSNNVSVIDTTSLEVTKTISVGLNPTALAVTPDGQRVYVANSGPGQDSVSVIKTSDDTEFRLAVFRFSPTRLAVSPDGLFLYVFGTGSRFVTTVKTATNQIQFLDTGQDPVSIAFSPDGRRAFVANQGQGTVSVLNTTTFPPSKLQDVSVSPGITSVAVSKEGKVYVTEPLNINPVDQTRSVAILEPGRDFQAFLALENPGDRVLLGLEREARMQISERIFGFGNPATIQTYADASQVIVTDRQRLGENHGALIAITTATDTKGPPTTVGMQPFQGTENPVSQQV
ncbi:MAG: choice-of-anchor D domain-containing protein [Deltaproteobacteria bacterium]|nr:choice-of-anchor D domain-containing protein [Deltaproteobacteria bacterium]